MTTINGYEIRPGDYEKIKKQLEDMINAQYANGPLSESQHQAVQGLKDKYAQILAQARAADPVANTGFDYRGRHGADDEDISRYRKMGEDRYNRSPILADYAQADQTRGEQGTALGLYRDAAMGRGPSAAQAQFQRGLDQSLAAGQSLANSARGGALGLAQARLAAAQQGGQMLAGATSQAAALRAQEMQAAMSGYGGLASQMRGQDLNAAQFQADIGLRNRAENDQTQLAYEGLGQGVANMALQGSLSKESTIAGQAQSITQQANYRDALERQEARDANATAAAIGGALVPYVGGAISAGAKGAMNGGVSGSGGATTAPVEYNGSNAGNVANAAMVGSATPPLQSTKQLTQPAPPGLASSMESDDPYRRRMRYA